jgi:hypothetical protein
VPYEYRQTYYAIDVLRCAVLEILMYKNTFRFLRAARLAHQLLATVLRYLEKLKARILPPTAF